MKENHMYAKMRHKGRMLARDLEARRKSETTENKCYVAFEMRNRRVNLY